MTKEQRHAAIRERAAEAIRDLYHNATPRYPRCETEKEERAFLSWFEDAARFEIEYLRDGGAYGRGYRAILTRNAERQFSSDRARAYYVSHGVRSQLEEQARSNRLDSRKAPVNSLWEKATIYGDLYQWGRGGRTLAPVNLVRQGGGSSFGLCEDYADDLPIADVVPLIQIVESFNSYVAAWCKSVPKQWAEVWAEIRDAEAEEEAEEIEAERPDMYA